VEHPLAPRSRRSALVAAVLTFALAAASVTACSDAADDDASPDRTSPDRTSSTTEAATLGPPAENQTPPAGTNGLAFDADGRLWIADLEGGQILAVDPEDGSVLVRLGEDDGVRTPDDLVFDADGRLWWTENAVGAVGRIDDPLDPDAASETVATLGAGANPIAIDDRGAVFVARTLAGDALYRLDPDDPGDPHLVKDGPGQLNAFSFGADGMLYAPRFVDGAGVVSAIDPATGEATDLVGGLPLAVSVEVAADGTLRVLTVAPATVWTVDGTGAHEVLTELPSAAVDNQAFDDDGDLWVSAFDRPLVWRVAADGAAEPTPVPIGRADG
jgi:streptogramin lyase